MSAEYLIVSDVDGTLLGDDRALREFTDWLAPRRAQFRLAYNSGRFPDSIRQSIERGIMNQTRTIRLPIHVVKQLNVYLRGLRELTQKLDHEPTVEDVAALLDKPVEEVRRMLNLEERVDSLDALRSLGDRSMLEMVPDEGTLDPAIEVQESNLMVRLDGLLDELPEKQREVVSRRFGLRGHDTSTLEEVGKAVGLTRERVRQIQMEALKRLRRGLENQGLSADGLFEN